MFFFNSLKRLRLIEYLGLVALNVQATFFRLFDCVRTILCYPRFLRLYLEYLISYSLENPYRISLEFHKEQGFKNPYLFGVTPISAIDRIASECGILSTDHVIELGSGTALGLLWLESQIGCQTTGIEWIPRLVEKSRKLASRHALKTHLILGDFFKQDFSDASFIYVYGTCMQDNEIKRLCEMFSKLDRKSQFITVSFSLSEYSSDFEEVKRFSVRYPWGTAFCFLNIIKFKY